MSLLEGCCPGIRVTLHWLNERWDSENYSNCAVGQPTREPFLIIADDIATYERAIRTRAAASVPISMFRFPSLSLTGPPYGSVAMTRTVEPILMPNEDK